jgi:hypothetical protein
MELPLDRGVEPSVFVTILLVACMVRPPDMEGGSQYIELAGQPTRGWFSSLEVWRAANNPSS